MTSTGVEDVVRLSPDGRWVLYQDPKLRLMRIPASGGEPQQVFAVGSYSLFQCSRVQGGPCEIMKLVGQTSTISLFDPLKGPGPPILRTSMVADDPGISPDGQHLAFVLQQAPARIRIVSLKGATEKEIPIEGASS